MRIVAVIPARGGSKGVPGKNVARVGGVPLVVRAIRACQAAPLVDAVVVSTDGADIAEAARGAGAQVVERPAEISGDQATSEAALLHALDQQAEPVDIVVFVQCTSPFLTEQDVQGVAQAVVDGADSAFTGAPTHGFIWRTGDDGAYGVNHDKATRPRRQDRPAEYLETGAAYAMRAEGFRTHGHRFFGRTEVVPVDPALVLEIDDPADLERARALAPLLDQPETPTRGDVDAVVLDFDGTQTDDTVLVAADGAEQVRVHRGDGLGIAALKRAGIPVLILSTETNPVVRARATKLDVPIIHGHERKGPLLEHWMAEQGLDPQRVLFAGNDVNDLPCLALVGWPVAVATAHPIVLEAARVRTVAPGGQGAIREIASWLLGRDLA